ncbi:DUF1292 domain-containing protein [Litchfieldia salsa]|uniref:DUF1292 domain-containing protein n=1 Tax=Litchfieldia salsa TaxID=930152 RepID=A0A1H0X1Y7_9BACI|nr:DUF1292 domain-containing protein [Litchfieldia salsa]SDP96953.1 Protein of unknown function [Litchfieldia salsa]
MENEEIRDSVTIEDENGNEKEYHIEALFDMEEDSYALLRDGEETVLMRIEEEDSEQYLVGIDDPTEKNLILDAYQIAVEAAPADH